MKASAVYLLSILAINWGFAHMPGWELAWSFIAGSVFVTRDIAQRAIGHRVILVMIVASALSYWLADPFVALASVTAFAASEAIDWIVYTVTKRPLHARILWSSAISVPVDTVIFLGMLGILSPALVAAQLASKWTAAIIVAGGLWGVSRARHA